MKIYSSIILLCFLPLLLGNSNELGGAKVALNDYFINSILAVFENDIKNLIQEVELKPSKHFYNMVFSVPNFSLDKIKLSFGDDGIINININNLEPFLSGTFDYKIIARIRKSFKVTLKKFSLDAKVRVKSRLLSNGKYAPDAEFVEAPKLKFKINLNLSGSIANMIAKLLSLAGNFAKNIVLPLFKSKFNSLLSKMMTKLPTEARIGNYWIDFTLASPIQLKNKFIELNSYAHIFSKEYPETQDKNRYPLSNFPSISNNQFQLFVSEYSINLAAFTYLTVNKNNTLLKYSLSISFINFLLPGISKKYTVKNAEILFSPKPEANTKLTEEFMYFDIPGTFYVKVENVENPVFACELNLTLKAQANVEYGPKMTAKITELSGIFGEIIVNEATDSPKETIVKGFDTLKNAIVPLMNEYIKKYVNLPFPTIMGINFTDVEVRHKDKYMLVNFNLSK